jgi:hypothetical protein
MTAIATRGFLLITCLWSAQLPADALRVTAVDRTLLDVDEAGAEYLMTVSFSNDSSDPDPAPYVVATVPGDARLVEGSATGPGAAVSIASARELARSLDDGEEEFATGTADDPGFEGETAPADVGPLRIRWDLPGPMDPGVTGIVSFRIRTPHDAAAELPERPAAGPDAGIPEPPGATGDGEDSLD